MKPIEPGCLVMHTGSKRVPESAGVVATVIRYVGKAPDHNGNGWWELDTLTLKRCVLTGNERMTPYARASALIRIDGGDFEGEKEHDEIRQSESCC